MALTTSQGAMQRYMSNKKLSTGHKIAIWTVALVLVDQIVKMLVHCNMEVGDKIEVFKWFNLCYVENPGFAFGMQLGGGGDGVDWGKITLSIFRLVMIGALIYGIRYLIKKGSEVPKGVVYAAMFILAGAIGNMVDSMFYGLFIEAQGTGFLTGKVIDMVHLPLFKWESCPSFLSFLVGGDGYFFGAVFNVADAYISCAVVYLLIFQYKFFK